MGEDWGEILSKQRRWPARKKSKVSRTGGWGEGSPNGEREEKGRRGREGRRWDEGAKPRRALKAVLRAEILALPSLQP